MLGDKVARAAQRVAADVVTGAAIDIEVLLFDREGRPVGQAPFQLIQDGAPARNRR
jgi:cobalt-precorrin-5B (C1)-methyltransferase